MTQRITRAQAFEIAKRVAARSNLSYYTGEDFHPHEWVIEAILEAANTQYKIRDDDGNTTQG